MSVQEMYDQSDIERWPLGTITVERRIDVDQAWKRVGQGWVECDPPPRSADTKDHTAEIWWPEGRRTAWQ